MIERCNRNGMLLWTYDQVEVSALKQAYSDDSLYLLTLRSVRWGRLFFHKFAIGNSHHASGLGELALTDIRLLTQRVGCYWILCRLVSNGGCALVVVHLVIGIKVLQKIVKVRGR